MKTDQSESKACKDEAIQGVQGGPKIDSALLASELWLLKLTEKSEMKEKMGKEAREGVRKMKFSVIAS